MPQFCISRCKIEIQVAIVDTGLDHRSLKPLIEGRDSDPQEQPRLQDWRRLLFLLQRAEIYV